MRRNLDCSKRTVTANERMKVPPRCSLACGADRNIGHAGKTFGDSERAQRQSRIKSFCCKCHRDGWNFCADVRLGMTPERQTEGARIRKVDPEHPVLQDGSKSDRLKGVLTKQDILSGHIN